MLQPTITTLDFSYKRAGRDLWVLNQKDIPINLELVKDEQLVYIGHGGSGGNHAHKRVEWFVGIGELEFIWLDEDGNKQSRHMHPKGQLLLFEVPSFLPHAVRNISDSTFGLLYELADGPLVGEKEVKVI